MLHLCRCYPCPGCVASRVDRYDCFSQFFHFLYKFWINLVFFQITSQSVHTSRARPFIGFFLPTFIVDIFLPKLLSFNHHMGIPGNAAVCDICGDWLGHTLFIQFVVQSNHNLLFTHSSTSFMVILSCCRHLPQILRLLAVLIPTTWCMVLLAGFLLSLLVSNIM